MTGLGADTALRAPFPWYGGKRRVASNVWALLGDCSRYVEPFAGSLGVLLGRPEPFGGLEVVNDLDGYVVNAWRAMKHDPRKTAEYAIDLVSELDLTARHLWLVNEGRELLAGNLAADPEWFDARTAGWWLHGVAGWIGTGYCSGKGPWTRDRLRNRKLPHLGDDGRGVNRQLPHLGNDGQGVKRKLPHLGNDGQGVNRQLPHLGNDGQDNDQLERCAAYMQAISRRLSRVVVASGDWQRTVTPSALGTRTNRRVGIFLDPPYRQHGNEYGVGDSGVEELWTRLEAWAADADPALAVVVCGYEGDFNAPDGWGEIAYTATGTSTANASRERFWISPACHQESRLF